MVLRVFVGIFMPIFRSIKKIKAWLWIACFRFKKRAGAVFKAKKRAKKYAKQQNVKEANACRRKRKTKAKKA